MSEMRDLYFNIDVSEVLKILTVSQLRALFIECRDELGRRLVNNEK